MSDLESIKEAIRNEYNHAISVYDYTDFIRVTNGSAAHRVDIRIHNGRCELKGERYSERIEKECDPTPEAVLGTLSRTI